MGARRDASTSVAQEAGDGVDGGMTAPFEPDRRLFPFESKWFQSSRGQVHYVDEGAGAPILFLHGNPTWSFLYRGIVIRLRKNFRCIAVDYPGFGLSPHPPGYGYTAAEHAEVVLELVKGLGLSNLTIMGPLYCQACGIKYLRHLATNLWTFMCN